MAFTITDFHDLVRLLEQHEEWRKELRRLLLTDELLNLPNAFRELHKLVDRRFAELAEAQRRTEEALAAHRAETDRRFAELAEALRNLSETFTAHRQEFLEYRAETERRFAELAEAQRRTEETLRQVLLRQEQFQRTLDRFGQTVGVTVEGQMVEAVQRYLAERGYVLLEPIATLAIDRIGELDGIARVARARRRRGLASHLRKGPSRAPRGPRFRGPAAQRRCAGSSARIWRARPCAAPDLRGGSGSSGVGARARGPHRPSATSPGRAGRPPTLDPGSVWGLRRSVNSLIFFPNGEEGEE